MKLIFGRSAFYRGSAFSVAPQHYRRVANRSETSHYPTSPARYPERLIGQRFTKALPPGIAITDIGPRLALVLSTTATRQAAAERAAEPDNRQIAWMGVVQRLNTVGPVDKSITIEPLRKCVDVVPIDGPKGFLTHLAEPHRAAFEDAIHSGDVGRCDWDTWNAPAHVIRDRHPGTGRVLDWLLAQANAPRLNNDDAADRWWQEERDALGTGLRISDFPLYTVAAWQRPTSPDEPYLAGLIPEPVENSLIEHDARQSIDEVGLFDAWRQRAGMRCDIHVMSDSNGRRLEVANVNNTPVERRLGTDLVYYHEPTHSFVLVQYKRVNARTRSITVNERLLSQLDRLEAVAELSSRPVRPHDWRLGNDPCFLKLAHWPDNRELGLELAPGMYLPLSYARMLLADDCTFGRGDSRILGPETIERYLVGTQFVELVKHGLAGTVGTTVDQLRNFGAQRAEQGTALSWSPRVDPRHCGNDKIAPIGAAPRTRPGFAITISSNLTSIRSMTDGKAPCGSVPVTGITRTQIRAR